MGSEGRLYSSKSTNGGKGLKNSKINSYFIATLFSKTIDFDQPYKNALFYNGKMRFSQNPPKIDTLYYHGVK